MKEINLHHSTLVLFSEGAITDYQKISLHISANWFSISETALNSALQLFSRAWNQFLKIMLYICIQVYMYLGHDIKCFLSVGHKSKYLKTLVYSIKREWDEQRKYTILTPSYTMLYWHSFQQMRGEDRSSDLPDLITSEQWQFLIW